MRVAVYAIAKNEQAHVARWAASCVDADVRFVLDTCSTDGTIDALKTAGVKYRKRRVRPWRFDDARNLALDALPDDVDYCIALDLDEILLPGWRAELEIALEQGVTRPRYRYVWSWNPDGTPGLVYGGDKIHSRHGYRWKHPVHEVLAEDGIEETQGWTGLEIHHYPDPTKSRADYLPMLTQAVTEAPDDDRLAFYHARDLMYAGRTAEAAAEFERHLGLPSAVWRPERSASMRYRAQCTDDPNDRETWLLRAAGEAPWHREPWVALASHYYDLNFWPACYAAATRALRITARPLEYLNEPASWGPLPHDLAALAAHRLGLVAEAIIHGLDAADLDPTDPRLRANVAFYQDGHDVARLLRDRKAH